MVNVSIIQMVVAPVEIKGRAEGAALLVIDVQERLAPAIPAADAVVARIAALIEKASLAMR